MKKKYDCAKKFKSNLGKNLKNVVYFKKTFKFNTTQIIYFSDAPLIISNNILSHSLFPKTLLVSEFRGLMF